MREFFNPRSRFHQRQFDRLFGLFLRRMAVWYLHDTVRRHRVQILAAGTLGTIAVLTAGIARGRGYQAATP
jgi:hypothetical protein